MTPTMIIKSLCCPEPYVQNYCCTVLWWIVLLFLSLSLSLFLFLFSFHVGSGCQTPSAYQDALAMCADMFHYGASIGYNFTLLDIGGGYPGEKGSEKLFEKVTNAINQALSEHFNSSRYPNLDIIAEPGKLIIIP